HRTQARLESALEAGLAETFYWDIRHGVVITDDNMRRYVSLSDRALDQGVPLDDALPAIHEDDRSRVTEALADAAAQRGPYQIEYRVRHSDGGVRWLSARGGVECGADGQAVGLAGFTVDVTERKQAEDRLRDSEERYRAIVESQAEMICRFRLDGTILFVNGAYARARRTSPEALVGLDFWSFVDQADRPNVRASLDRLQPDAREIRVENRFETIDGTRWTLWTNYGLAFDAHGRATEVQSSGIDITDRKRAEEALAESEASLRNANRMKDEFLATLSHELRTPLNAVLGWSHMLRTGKLSAESIERALDSLERNARAQTQLVDDLLDMSRIVSGKMQIRLERVDLAGVIAAAAETVLPAAAGKGVSLQVTTGRDGQVEVNGDVDRLRQMVWNLLSNAVKFTPASGRVEITLRRLDGSAEIVVSDTGEGIAEEFVPFVFDRFRQADATTTRHHGGLGIGLAIVRHLTEAHGGTVTAHSAGVNQGATFAIRLPTANVLRESPRDTCIERRRGSRLLQGSQILVVDDEGDARDLLKVVLETEGAAVTLAVSAGEALGLLHQRSFDVLLADIGMPGQDGLSLIRVLRASANRNAQLPAIAVTAYVSARERELAMEAGFSLHLSKPVEPEALVAAVAGVFAATGSARHRPSR
nr:PAS domain S-box protein [Acidobacteriota bacterium]